MSRIASGESALATLVQSAPRLISLVRQMRPTWHIETLADLHPEFLQRETITGLIWDVDGTLTGDRQTALAAGVESPFRALLEAPGTRHVILSNAGEHRYRQLGEMFPLVPVLRGYELKGERLYRRLLGSSDSWTDDQLAAHLAAGARVIRKPSAALVDYAVRELECERTAVLMIGDQYLTDVAGANLAGVRSVKLPTLARESFRASVRVSQRLELLLYRVFHRIHRSPVR